MDLSLIQALVQPAETKIVLLVMDGLGGLPQEPGGLTELEAAKTPNLDALASQGICGLQTPVGAGITPGSGPGHLALFGYDPLKYQVGRGVLSALGIDFDLTRQDIAARGNFCTVNEEGVVTDRRAGRISTELNAQLCQELRQIRLPHADLFVLPEKEHRFLFVLRGEDLYADITDTDPLQVGKKPLPPRPLSPRAAHAAELVEQFVAEARNILRDHHPANMVLLRGFAQLPDWPTVRTAYGLHGAAIAAYPMYRGIARLLEMDVLETPDDMSQEIDVLTEHWGQYDFFFVHAKHSDSAGEDGDFNRKVQAIEEVDRQVPRLVNLKPDVIIVTGDHSTPSRLKAHSWHPVPVILWSEYCRADQVAVFGERACMAGGLGPRFPATDLMPLALANARRLIKFGA
jgi:2,3-bisphosphoglycerate-independent phosphoglycerate mutase